MRFLLCLTLVINLFSACQNNAEKEIQVEELLTIDSTSSIEIDNIADINYDHLPRINVDDFPITNLMLSSTKSPVTIDSIYVSPDQVWFHNENSGEVLVFTLYTDYHRFGTFLFNENEQTCLPFNHLQLLEKNLMIEDPCIIKQLAPKFIKIANKVSQEYFESNKGISLNMDKTIFTTKYPEPDTSYFDNYTEVIIWHYMGEITPMLYEGKNPEEIAIDSYGHSIEAYFRDDKLIAYYLFNNIP